MRDGEKRQRDRGGQEVYAGIFKGGFCAAHDHRAKSEGWREEWGIERRVRDGEKSEGWREE